MNTPPLYLLAASGLAREAAEAARAAGRTLAGVFDDNPALHGTSCGGLDVLGSIDQAVDVDGEFVVCVGAGAGRRAVVQRLLAAGVAPAQFGTIVHPGSHLPASARLGRGAIVLAGVVVTADVTLGDHVVVMPGAVLTHDCHLDDYATIASGVLLGGAVRIGAAAYLGMGASVHPGCIVGADAVLGMAATVLNDVPPGQTWVGTPARPIGGR